MLKKIFEEVNSLEELLVECSEMAHFSTGINKMLISKNEAYLEEKNLNNDNECIDILSCEMYRYLSTT